MRAHFFIQGREFEPFFIFHLYGLQLIFVFISYSFLVHFLSTVLATTDSEVLLKLMSRFQHAHTRSQVHYYFFCYKCETFECLFV